MALSIGIRAEHLERHPDRSLAALASDPVITFGLELEIVQLSAIRALKRDRGGSGNDAMGRAGTGRRYCPSGCA